MTEQQYTTLLFIKERDIHWVYPGLRQLDKSFQGM